jgi:hypothetical protein
VQEYSQDHPRLQGGFFPCCELDASGSAPHPGAAYRLEVGEVYLKFRGSPSLQESQDVLEAFAALISFQSPPYVSEREYERSSDSLQNVLERDYDVATSGRKDTRAMMHSNSSNNPTDGVCYNGCDAIQSKWSDRLGAQILHREQCNI